MVDNEQIRFSFVFQSTLPMRGATFHGYTIQGIQGISIHAPHAGSDQAFRLADNKVSEFQSTLPMRGATKNQAPRRQPCSYFNPRSPCGERHCDCWNSGYGFVISIHAPHAGSDPLSSRSVWCSRYFNPRSPCGERLAGAGES